MDKPSDTKVHEEILMQKEQVLYPRIRRPSVRRKSRALYLKSQLTPTVSRPDLRKYKKRREFFLFAKTKTNPVTKSKDEEGSP